MNSYYGYYFNKDADMVERVFDKSFNTKKICKKNAIEIKFSVILRLNDLRIENNQIIENMSNSELIIKIYTMIEEQIKKHFRSNNYGINRKSK